METTIPKEIEDEMHSAVTDFCTFHPNAGKSYSFMQGTIFGYNLAQEEINELKRKSIVHGVTVINRLEEKENEIERLKGLIEKFYRDACPYSEEVNIQNCWQQFKEQNNL